MQPGDLLSSADRPVAWCKVLWRPQSSYWSCGASNSPCPEVHLCALAIDGRHEERNRCPLHTVQSNTKSCVLSLPRQCNAWFDTLSVSNRALCARTRLANVRIYPEDAFEWASPLE
ncbi:unnamed protein product [Ostreobium quekettii]|uniref:Uncharacterized protein n=1 Tax=Ostreobium quekettii TaxID=121088 RepID=A0A8S1J1S1_9CHLO|nr:unnamed protein product [Ostreobium quekettii]